MLERTREVGKKILISGGARWYASMNPVSELPHLLHECCMQLGPHALTCMLLAIYKLCQSVLATASSVQQCPSHGGGHAARLFHREQRLCAASGLQLLEPGGLQAMVRQQTSCHADAGQTCALHYHNVFLKADLLGYAVFRSGRRVLQAISLAARMQLRCPHAIPEACSISLRPLCGNTWPLRCLMKSCAWLLVQAGGGYGAAAGD